MRLCLPIILSLHLAFSNLGVDAALRRLRKNEDKNGKIVGGEVAEIGAYPAYAIPMGGGCGASVSADEGCDDGNRASFRSDFQSEVDPLESLRDSLLLFARL